MQIFKIILCSTFLLLVAGGCGTVPEQNEVSQKKAKTVLQKDLTFTSPSGREIPLRVYTSSAGCRVCTLIFFSHGASLTHDSYTLLFEEWVSQGYVIAAPLHVDSELHPDRKNYSGFDWIRTRLEDYEVIASAFLREDRVIEGVTLSGKFIAAGHSFGALTAQIAGGAELHPSVGATLNENAVRPLAIIALSPPGPIPDYVSSEGWSKINRPLLVVTGTDDWIPKFTPKWELHMASYEAAPAGNAYLLVFDDIDHYFNGGFGRPAPSGFVSNEETLLLNRIVLKFMGVIEAGEVPSSAAWASHSQNGLLATSR